MAIESQIRAAVRDCVNRISRKPFQWGGLIGYQQLSAIGEILRSLSCQEVNTDYLSLLSVWVDEALSINSSVASDLEQAHKWLQRIAECLRYPKYSHPSNEYKTQLRKLALAEAPRQRKYRLHHDPITAIQGLVNQHTKILSVLESQALKYQLDS